MFLYCRAMCQDLSVRLCLPGNIARRTLCACTLTRKDSGPGPVGLVPSPWLKRTVVVEKNGWLQRMVFVETCRWLWRVVVVETCSCCWNVWLLLKRMIGCNVWLLLQRVVVVETYGCLQRVVVVETCSWLRRVVVVETNGWLQRMVGWNAYAGISGLFSLQSRGVLVTVNIRSCIEWSERVRTRK